MQRKTKWCCIVSNSVVYAKKKDILTDVFLFWYVGLEEGGLHPVQVKNMPVVSSWKNIEKARFL
jgi:hypothetical protein